MSKVLKKFIVENNSRISDIYSKLNSIQKESIVLFDTNRDGILDAKEAKSFNSSIFSEQSNGDLDIYLKLQNGKKVKTTVNKAEFDSTVLSLEYETSHQQLKYINKQTFRKTAVLKKSKGMSVDNRIKSALSDGNWEKGATDKNGNTKYTLTYTVESENGSYEVSDYKILDITGNVIESQETLQEFWEDNASIYGKKVLKQGSEYYYDEKNNLVGSITKEEDMLKFLDKNGKCLYYQKGNDYYDSNKKLRYTIQESHDRLNYPSTVIIYDDNGNKKCSKIVYEPLGSPDISAQFKELSDDKIGIFEQP